MAALVPIENTGLEAASVGTNRGTLDTVANIARLVIRQGGNQMNSIDSFIELVENVCRRRNMYVAQGSYYEVCAYLTGYAQASPECPLAGDGWRAFNAFVCATFRFPNNHGWPSVIKLSSHDEDAAVTRLQNLLTDFAEKTRTQSHAEIVWEVKSRSNDREEGEPEKAWRRFSRAIHRANRAEVEVLIQEHPDADVLWSATYPDDVVPLMDQIQESYQVSQISGSEDDGEVTIITPNWGPVGVKLIAGTWRIDASKIIHCWKANRDKAQQQNADD